MEKEELIRTISLAFEGTFETPHFHKTSFRTGMNRIFATLDTNNYTLTLKLNEVNQSVFCDLGKERIFPVPGSWGRKGWTVFEYDHLHQDLLKDVLEVSFNIVSGT